MCVSAYVRVCVSVRMPRRSPAGHWNYIAVLTDARGWTAPCLRSFLQKSRGSSLRSSQPAQSVIGWNSGSGVYVEKGSSNVIVDGIFVGVGIDGATPVGNARSGIEIEASNTTLSNNVIGGSNPMRKADQSGLYGVGIDDDADGKAPEKLGHGIWVKPACKGARMHSNSVGLSQNLNQNVSNFGWGLWMQREELCSQGSHNDTEFFANYQIFNNTIGGNRRAGTYPEGVTFSNLKRLNQQNKMLDNRLQNQWGMQACLMCKCNNLNGKLHVDCSGQRLGPDFPRELPLNTHVLTLKNTGLIALDWVSLDALKQLEELDISENRLLAAVPQRGDYRLDSNSLMHMRIGGTDLSHASSTFLQSLGPQLTTIDVSSSSAPPSDVDFNASGMPRLRSFLWFDSKRCPAGWYASSTKIPLCERCPVGTFQPLQGQVGASACKECADDEVDHDKDPTTECTSARCKSNEIRVVGKDGLKKCVQFKVPFQTVDAACQWNSTLNSGRNCTAEERREYLNFTSGNTAKVAIGQSFRILGSGATEDVLLDGEPSADVLVSGSLSFSLEVSRPHVASLLKTGVRLRLLLHERDCR